MPCHRYTPFQAGRPAGPDLARPEHHPGPAVAVHRPPRRQPGPDRPHEPGPQAHHVRPAGPDGLQGDRGRLPVGQPDGLRLRPEPDRGRPDPRRRADLRAHPGPRRADRAHRAVPGRRAPRHRAHVQRHRAAVPPGGVRQRPRTRPRRLAVEGTRVGDEVRRAATSRTRLRLRVLARDLHGHRAGLRRSRCARRSWTSGSPARPGDHPEPARAPSSGPPRTCTPTRSSG